MYIRHISDKKLPTLSLKPDYIAKNVEDIDFDFLKNQGITTCFIDLDGTVVDRGTYEVTTTLRKKLASSGMNIIIATNRSKSKSLRKLKEQLSATAVVHPRGLYGKPTKRYFSNALTDLGLNKNEVVMIGDRYIQDILGGNISGIHTLLVMKLGKSKGIFDKLISRTERYVTIQLLNSYKNLN